MKVNIHQKNMELFHDCCHAGKGEKLHHTHQRPILGATVPHQKKPEQYESLQLAHISPPRQLPSLISQAGCGPACYLQLAVCPPPDARSAVFWRDPRKPCWHSLPPLQLGRVQSRPPPIRLLSALNLLTNSSHPPDQPLFSPHLLASLEKMP